MLLFLFTLYIEVEGYVKTNFSESFNIKLNKMIGYGSITEGTYKLEIHVLNFKYDDLETIDINKGDKIEVIGIMYNTSKKILIYS